MLKLEELKERLNDSIVSITFTKKDGTKREIKATTMEDLVAEVKTNEEDTASKKRTLPEDLLVVTDIEIGKWRSFRYDQITDITSLKSVL